MLYFYNNLICVKLMQPNQALSQSKETFGYLSETNWIYQIRIEYANKDVKSVTVRWRFDGY